MPPLWLIALAILAVGVSWWMNRRHLRSLPDTPDDQFAQYCATHAGIDPDDAIVERREVAKIVGVPAEKLAPDIPLGRLAASQFDIGPQVGLGDLENDLISLADKAGVREQLTIPDTVAGVLRLRMNLKAGRGSG